MNGEWQWTSATASELGAVIDILLCLSSLAEIFRIRVDEIGLLFAARDGSRSIDKNVPAESFYSIICTFTHWSLELGLEMILRHIYCSILSLTHVSSPVSGSVLLSEG